MKNSREPERRRKKRVTKVATITACCDGTRKIDGAVVNISESGLCFYTDKPLEVGLVIDVEGTFRLKDFSERCTVVWSKKIGAELYRVGISYGGGA